MDKNPMSGRHRSVSDAESSQPQFPLCDGPWEEVFSDSANLDSNIFRSATCRTQQRSENISSHQALPATLASRQEELGIPEPETLNLFESQSRTSSQRPALSQSELSPAAVNSAIMAILTELARDNLEQRKITAQNQKDAIKYQREKDKQKNNQTNALAGQTEQHCHLLALCLTPMEDLVDARPFAFKDLTFSPTMKKLIETKNQVHILNQIDQHMGDFRCRPNKPLWFQWIKSCSFLPPPGMDFGGCCSFMMIPGYLSTTAEEAALKQSLAMQLAGEKSDADLVKLLGESQIVAPITDNHVFNMFNTLSKFFEILARKKPCIASSGYAKAAELVGEHGRDIDKLKDDPSEGNFLLRLCHSVDLECRFLFLALFKDILSTGTGTYSMNLRREIRNRNDDIEKIFHGLKRGDTNTITFPSNVLALVHSHHQQQQRSDGRS